LIDEYDKPIIDFLEQEPFSQAKVNQGIMREFYSVLKSAEPYLRFFFVTGVSKFSQVSMFSELNNLKDITIHEDYATLTGYTQQELVTYFDDYLQLAMEKLHISREELLKQMGIWYNGFSWDGINKVYNPFGTLNFLDERIFKNYWFSTGNPKFLIHQMKKHVQFDIENTRINSYSLNKYDIDNLDLVPLCFQTGYLTIKHIDPMTGDMILDYPNKEVRESMYQFMIDDISSTRNPNTGMTMKDLNKAFLANDMDSVQTIINSLLASLPYETYKKQSEGFYHGLLHLIFSYLGMFIESEPHLSNGRADVVVQTPQYIYIFEFKFNKNAEDALAQIKTKDYADKYRATGKPIMGIGVNFNKTKKKIVGWLAEPL
jgi:Predicted AAA-ATPase/PD-(D/E)XK nuclease superfamily